MREFTQETTKLTNSDRNNRYNSQSQYYKILSRERTHVRINLRLKNQMKSLKKLVNLSSLKPDNKRTFSTNLKTIKTNGDKSDRFFYSIKNKNVNKISHARST